MNLKSVFVDDDAVSPVIGVILMVAITVILAAVIGTFVLGLGDQVQSTSPQASFSFDYTNSSGTPGDELAITHDGGDSVSAGELNATVSGALYDDDATAAGGEGTAAVFGSNAAGDGDLFTGDDVVAGRTDTLDYDDFVGLTTTDPPVAGDDHLNLASSTVRVVWTSDSGDNSATLSKWTGPKA